MSSKHQCIYNSTGGSCTVLCVSSPRVALAMGAKSVTVIEVSGVERDATTKLLDILCNLLMFPVCPVSLYTPAVLRGDCATCVNGVPHRFHCSVVQPTDIRPPCHHNAATPSVARRPCLRCSSVNIKVGQFDRVWGHVSV